MLNLFYKITTTSTTQKKKNQGTLPRTKEIYVMKIIEHNTRYYIAFDSLDEDFTHYGRGDILDK